MAADLLARIKQSAVLCDGAMGTLLYAKGIFINRSYDELNLSQPELIRGVHHDYLQATSTWRELVLPTTPLKASMCG
jgi:methionine synthase I (cobalamin-dependent)